MHISLRTFLAIGTYLNPRNWTKKIFYDNRITSHCTLWPLIDPSQSIQSLKIPHSDNNSVLILSYNVLLNTVWYAKSIQLPSCITNISNLRYLF